MTLTHSETWVCYQMVIQLTIIYLIQMHIFIKTDAPNGFKHFTRAALATGMEGDFDTGNMRYKARERYSFGFSDPRCVYGSQGS